MGIFYSFISWMGYAQLDFNVFCLIPLIICYPSSSSRLLSMEGHWESSLLACPCRQHCSEPDNQTPRTSFINVGQEKPSLFIPSTCLSGAASTRSPHSNYGSITANPCQQKASTFAGQRLNLFDFWAICNLEKQNKKQKLATPSTDTKFGMKRGEVRFTGLRHFRGTWARGFGFDHGLWTKITEMRG